MSKYVIFSFDDGRLDTYTEAYEIIKKYNLTCTINITTAFVEDETIFKNEFKYNSPKSMTKENIIECYKQGIEIASHSDMHTNKIDDIQLGINKLKQWGIDTTNIGFASPRSYYYKNNYNEIKSLIDNETISYVRSGRVLRRDGLLHAGLSIIMNKTHSKYLFKVVNRRNVIKYGEEYKILPSVTVNSQVTNNQIKYLISSLKEEEAIILMYHSIVKGNENEIKKDKWYNTIGDFENLCSYLSKQKDIDVIRTIDLVKGVLNV